jgi:hypothetical protein
MHACFDLDVARGHDVRGARDGRPARKDVLRLVLGVELVADRPPLEKRILLRKRRPSRIRARASREKRARKEQRSGYDKFRP